MTRVRLVQLPVPEATPRRVTGLAPLGVASLVLHARHVGAAEGHDVALLDAALLRRAGDARLLSALVDERPDVVGFTVTVWNVERSLALALRLKQALPGVRVWMGGPEVARDAPFVTASRAAVDVAVEGEGEAAFAALLAAAEPSLLPGARAMGAGTYLPSRALGTLPDLSSLHDPYLEGLVAPEADGALSLEAWRGCRYHCTFCRYHAGRGQRAASRPGSQVEQVLGWAAEHGVREVYLLDPSLEQRPDLVDFLASLAHANPARLPLFVELRAEAVDDATAGRLAAAGVRWVEVGLQTTTPEALQLTARTFDRERFVQGLRALRGHGLRPRVDLMLGLPGDRPDGLRRSLDFVLQQDLADHVQLFRTKVLPGTALRRQAARLGVAFEPTPPYAVLSTPTWPREALQAAVAEAERALGRDTSGLEAPVVLRPAWGKAAAVVTPFPGADATFQYAYRLDAREGRAALAEQRFEHAAVTAALWLEADDLAAWRRPVTTALGRFLAANPFASLTVALVTLPETALDPFADVDAALDLDRPSRYLEALAEAPRPERRVLAVLERPWAAQVDPGWLEALRELATVAWMARPADVDAALPLLEAAGELDDRDVLLLAPREVDDDAPAKVRALAGEVDPDVRVTWSPLELHWAWQDARERADERGA
jgi:hypothetical protein